MLENLVVENSRSSKDVKEHQAKIVELQNQIAQIQEGKLKNLKM